MLRFFNFHNYTFPSYHSRTKSVSTSDSNSHKKIRSTLFKMLLIYFFIKTCQRHLIYNICVVDASLQIVNCQLSIIYTLVRSWRRLCSPDLLYPCRRRSMLPDGRSSLLARCASRQGCVISNIM